MKEIPLTQGKVALVDDEDYEIVSQHKWCLDSKGYAHRFGGREHDNKKVRLHREIMQPPANMDIDHINGNPLDCRRSNMRICTRGQNLRNLPVRKTNISGFKGVCWHPGGQKWMARIAANGKQIYIGLFVKPDDAARAYDTIARELHGEFARLNFP